MLKPLPILIRPWTDITLDFVTGQPSSNGYNAVLMVIDQLTKERHYIPCTTDENGTTAEGTAYLLFNNVWKLHGLFLLLTLDWGLQLISGVWKNLCKILGIKVYLSTVFHPETDGQSEIVNQEMERHLLTFVNYQQDYWSEKLAMAEFAANNNESSSTKLSPFFASKGLHPRMSFDIVDLSNANTRERIHKQKALDISGNIETTWEFARKTIASAQKIQSKQIDKHWKNISYNVRNKFWLSTRNITTDQPSKKLDYKMLGFFEIIGNKGVFVKLLLL